MEDSSDEEAQEARERVLKRYDRANISDEPALDPQEDKKKKLDDEFADWKKDYYKDKFDINVDKNPEKLRAFIFKYLEGLQWVLSYYYSGVPSWSWFFPYHYGPKVTDVVDISEFKFDLQISTPFHPFEQLMGVLPAASGKHIPEPFRVLFFSFSRLLLLLVSKHLTQKKSTIFRI